MIRNLKYLVILAALGLSAAPASALFDQTVVEVAGHTDSTGTDAYNQQLSERRARTVTDYFVARNISAQRFITVGLGESMPVADNGTPSARS